MKKLHREGKLSDAQKGCIETPRPTEYLFDVAADPHCIHNLANDPGHQKQLSELRDALKAWQNETEDRFPGEDKLTPDGFDRDNGKRLISKSHPSFQ